MDRDLIDLFMTIETEQVKSNCSQLFEQNLTLTCRDDLQIVLIYFSQERAVHKCQARDKLNPRNEIVYGLSDSTPIECNRHLASEELSITATILQVISCQR